METPLRTDESAETDDVKNVDSDSDKRAHTKNGDYTHQSSTEHVNERETEAESHKPHHVQDTNEDVEEERAKSAVNKDVNQRSESDTKVHTDLQEKQEHDMPSDREKQGDNEVKSSKDEDKNGPKLEIHFDPKETLKHRLPKAIIFGFSKCGTRALLNFLSLHPRILTAGNEVDFFNRHYEEGLNWYRNLMPESYKSQIVMEKSPEYVHDPDTPIRIHHMNNTIKLMVLVCDPVRRAVSEYVQRADNAVRDGKQVHSFEYFAIDEKSGEANEESNILQRGRFSFYLKQWMPLFTSDQIFIGDGDQLRNDPVPVLKEAETFLGIEKFFDNSLFVFNATKGFYCMQDKCLGESKGRPHPTIDGKTLAAVKKYYIPHNEELYRMVGKEFDW